MALERGSMKMLCDAANPSNTARDRLGDAPADGEPAGAKTPNVAAASSAAAPIIPPR